MSGQPVLLSIKHNVDLELTLSLPLGPVPWLLSISDGMSIKTDESKLLHFLKSYIKRTIGRPSNAAHIIDENAILYSFTAISVKFEEQGESVFNQSPKAEHVDIVTDTFIQCILNKSENATPELFAIYIQNYANQECN